MAALSVVALLGACSTTGSTATETANGPQLMWRTFPQDSLRGDMTFVSNGEVLLNGKPARMSPGVRIRGENNTIALSNQFVGQRAIVNYKNDAMGLIHEVWVLTPAERAKGPWPATPEQAQAWEFQPATQSWVRR